MRCGRIIGRLWLRIAGGLNEECLNIKLRESIKGEAEAYMGVTGMCAYMYNQMWAKMEQRYSLPKLPVGDYLH